MNRSTVIFLGPHGQRLDRDAAGRIVRRVAGRAGITKKVGSHTLRHALITAALDAACRFATSRKRTSHADPRTTIALRPGPSLDSTAKPPPSSPPSLPAQPGEQHRLTFGRLPAGVSERRSRRSVCTRTAWSGARTSMDLPCGGSRIVRVSIILGARQLRGGEECGGYAPVVSRRTSSVALSEATGSAWRWTTFHSPSSRRNTVVARSV